MTLGEMPPEICPREKASGNPPPGNMSPRKNVPGNKPSRKKSPEKNTPHRIPPEKNSFDCIMKNLKTKMIEGKAVINTVMLGRKGKS